ncbi:BTAD domain-containing putative transcriptional regulator [Streptomyces sp. NPDC059534]|uniref:AfsR/SARP family transcriptional regulator n=1 Tax=Streptomyces sp. NPDC059534 TaxID=3346859 RepID=UPI0036A72236
MFLLQELLKFCGSVHQVGREARADCDRCRLTVGLLSDRGNRMVKHARTPLAGVEHPDGNSLLRYQVLGPVRLLRGDVPLAVGGPRQQRVLATLLMEANHVVPLSRLIDTAWQDSPSTARSQIQTSISRLRRALSTTDGQGPIVTQGADYLLRVKPDQLDSMAFQDLVASAHASAAKGFHDRAVTDLRAALALWCGPALAGMQDSGILESWAGSLEEARLAAMEACLRFEIRRGRHAEIVSELMESAESHPLREGFQGLLMQALYLSQRQAEALAVYRQTRQRLIEQLGVEPGSRLRRLEAEILAGDTTSWGPSGQAGGVLLNVRAASVKETVPQLLPNGLPDFVGRTRQIQRLAQRLVSPEGDENGSPPMVVLHGRGGSGKSALALRVAHAVREHFPDGQLYADMQGMSLQPMEPARLLWSFLRALGVDAGDIPEELDGRARLFRSLLEHRRMLVVIDDLPPDVEPLGLLATGPGSAVILNCRSRLPAAPGMVMEEVRSLDSEEAVELLGRIAGASRVATEWQAAHVIAQLCDRLPLALRIVGSRLAIRPDWRLEEMVRRLGNEPSRLGELIHGGLAVRTSLAMVYRCLTPEAQRLMRRLAALEIPTFGCWVADAVLRRSGIDACVPLRELRDAHLIEAVDADGTDESQFRFHDLVRVFAREVSQIEESEEEIARSKRDLIETYLALARKAHCAEYGGNYTLLHGQGGLREPRIVPASLLRAPLQWMDKERTNLMWASREAARGGADEVSWDLAVVMVTLFETLGYYDEWHITHTEALNAVRRAGNRRGEAALLSSLGALHIFRHDLAGADVLLRQALEIFGELGEEHGRALVLRNVAYLQRLAGDMETARGTYQEALAGCRAAGDLAAEAHILINMAQIDRADGQQHAAEVKLDHALKISLDIKAQRVAAQGLFRRGEVFLQNGEFEQADRLFSRAMEIVRARGDFVGETHVLYGLGVSALRQARLEEAAVLLETGLVMAESAGTKALRGQVLTALGEVHTARGEHELAALRLREAAVLCGRTGEDVDSDVHSDDPAGPPCSARRSRPRELTR